MDWPTALASGSISGIVVAFIAGIVSRQNSERTIQIENITKERTKWRDKIRAKANEVHQAAMEKDSAKLRALWLEFCLNLNPLDKEDRAILKLIDELSKCQEPDYSPKEISERVALLLKHDWDRAKHEAKHHFFRRVPTRTSYEEFKQGTL